MFNIQLTLNLFLLILTMLPTHQLMTQDDKDKSIKSFPTVESSMDSLMELMAGDAAVTTSILKKRTSNHIEVSVAYSSSPSVKPYEASSKTPSMKPMAASSVLTISSSPYGTSVRPSSNPSKIKSTGTPTSLPTLTSSKIATKAPIQGSTLTQSSSPSVLSRRPTSNPSISKSPGKPTVLPTPSPSRTPSSKPLGSSTLSQTSSPSKLPSSLPSASPSVSPSTTPSSRPTPNPLLWTPTNKPTTYPIPKPSQKPVPQPTYKPTLIPRIPSVRPTIKTVSPSLRPTNAPKTPNPTVMPTFKPTKSKPTTNPTTFRPSPIPTENPTSKSPTGSPTIAPTIGYSKTVLPDGSQVIQCSSYRYYDICVFLGCPGDSIVAKDFSCIGDQILQINNSIGLSVASNDDYWGKCSQVTYFIPQTPGSPSCQEYSLIERCFLGKQCSGAPTITITPIRANFTFIQAGIQFHGGALMVTPPNVYMIYYGDWSGTKGLASSSDVIDIITGFIQNLGGSQWWNILQTYPGAGGYLPSTAINFKGNFILPYLSTTLITQQIIQNFLLNSFNNGIIPLDSNGVYVVVPSQDVIDRRNLKDDGCSSYCGYHYFFVYGRVEVKVAFITNPFACPNQKGCLVIRDNSINGNPAADAMISVIAHEVAEVVTSPTLQGWYDVKGDENADKCAWNFKPTFKGPAGNLNWNIGLSTGKKYLVQNNWVNSQQGFCGMTFNGSLS